MEILFYFLKALILTILVEWGLSLIFVRSRHDRIVVILAQCITNPILNLIILIFPLVFVFWPALYALELLIIISEAIIYKRAFKQKSKIPPLAFSAITNIASFVIGLVAPFML